MKCTRCEDCGLVCEDHPGRLWQGDHACTCGAAGMPCPGCNQIEEGEEPPPGSNRLDRAAPSRARQLNRALP
jgi:hypothetical protein